MAVLTEDQFAQKWAGKFADNTIQNIDEPVLREFKEDIKDSFATVAGVSDLANTAQFLGKQAGVASFLLSTPAVRKHVAGLLRRRPLLGRTNIVGDPVAPLPAIPASAIVALPAGLTAPGTSGFTVTAKGTALAGTPQIAEWTRGGKAGSVIAISGENLLAGTAAVLAHGKLYQAKVRNTSARLMQVQLPKNLGPFDVFVLWPGNAVGYGEPVLLNSVEAWWTEDQLVAGELFSVFGDYVAAGDVTGTTNSYLGVHSLVDNEVYEAEIVEVKHDYVVARAPVGLAVGEVELYLHNTHGGIYGVSKPVRTTCVARQNHIKYKTFPTIVNMVLDPAGTLDSGNNGNGRRIQDAANGSNGLKSLVFPRGTFYLRDAAFLGSGGVELLGTANEDGSAGTIFIIGAGFYANFGAFGSTGDLDGLRVKNIELRNLDGTDYNGAPKNEQISFNFKRVTNSYFYNTNILTPQNVPFSAENGIERLYIEKCTFMGRGSSAIQGRQLFIDDCTYYGASVADSLFNCSGVIESAARNITFGDKTPGSTDENETMKGRFYKVGLNYGSTYHVCVSYNTGHNVGPLASLSDQNEGELILAEGAWQVYAAAPTATTANTITFADSLSNHYDDYDDFPFLKMTLNVVPGKHMLRITDGPGAGQVFHILSHDGYTLTLDRPFRVRPTADSLVSIGLAHDRFSVEGNNFSGRDGVASRDGYNVQCGVDFYNNGSRCNVKANTFTRLRAGVRIDGGYEVDSYKGDRQVLSTMFVNIAGNLFDGCRRHVFLVAAQDDRNPPNYYTFPAAAIVGIRLSGNTFQDALVNDVEIEAARTEEQSALNNGASLRNISFDGEFGIPREPIFNYWRFYEGLSPLPLVPSTLENFLLAPPATDVEGVASADATPLELGPVEELPADAAVTGPVLSFSQEGDSVLGYLDTTQAFVPLAGTLSATESGESPAPGTGYTDDQIDAFLADKAATADVYTRLEVNAILTAKRNVVVAGGNAVQFDRDYEYPPIANGTFTVDVSTRQLGMEVTAYLLAGASAPVLDPAVFQLLGGAFVAGTDQMYTFKVSITGKIQYIITPLS